MKKSRILLVAMAVVLVISGLTVLAEETPYANLPKTAVTAEQSALVDEANAPKITTLKNGIQIQRTPEDTTNVYGRVLTSWNNLYLNADNRGCVACHSLETALKSMDSYHGEIFIGYNKNEQTLENCYACHKGFKTNDFKDAIHTGHNRSAAFKAMNGSCESCHYIEDGGSFKMWDFVKYDVLRGFKKIPAEKMTLSFDYNQTQMTEPENFYFKTIKSEPSQWLTDDSQITDDIFKNWMFTVDGDVENPFTMTLPEMVEKFGTVKQIMKSHCVINGIGQAMIYQTEVTGIPFSKIVEYVKPKPDANMTYPYGDDGYCYNVHTQEALDQGSIIVLEINGTPLPAGQGFPAAWWSRQMSAGNFSKRLNKITISHNDGAAWALYGWFVDDKSGEFFNKPNMGILNAANGQIFKQGEPLHFEGYADAWDEPITKLEYSFDSGETWTAYDLKTDADFWTYWTLDINTPLDPGSYLIKMKATSVKADGTERQMVFLVNFMFTVK